MSDSRRDRADTGFLWVIVAVIAFAFLYFLVAADIVYRTRKLAKGWTWLAVALVTLPILLAFLAIWGVQSMSDSIAGIVGRSIADRWEYLVPDVIALGIAWDMGLRVVEAQQHRFAHERLSRGLLRAQWWLLTLGVVTVAFTCLSFALDAVGVGLGIGWVVTPAATLDPGFVPFGLIRSRIALDLLAGGVAVWLGVKLPRGRRRTAELAMFVLVVAITFAGVDTILTSPFEVLGVAAGVIAFVGIWTNRNWFVRG